MFSAGIALQATMQRIGKKDHQWNAGNGNCINSAAALEEVWLHVVMVIVSCYWDIKDLLGSINIHILRKVTMHFTNSERKWKLGFR